MEDKARFPEISKQPPVIQLAISFLVVVLAGTLFFYLFAFAGSLIFSKEVSFMLALTDGDAGEESVSILKYIQVSQQISMFFVPVFIISLLMRNGKDQFLRMNRRPGLFPVLMVILLALVLIQVTSYTGILNSRMVLPDWLSGIEAWMMDKEKIAGDLTNLLLISSGAGDLVINILILSVIPAIGEEMLFRGVLQQLLSRVFRSGHAGIWVTAFIFSSIHLQFYGFLPRLLLGLVFGYLFFWTGNLWIAIIAHFINNIVPVFLSSFIGWKELVGKAAELTEGRVIIPFVPVLICTGILCYFWLEYRKRLVNSKT